MSEVKPLGERDANVGVSTPQSDAKGSKGKAIKSAGNVNVGKKRKSGDANDAPIDLDAIELPAYAPIPTGISKLIATTILWEQPWNANQVRSKIRQYLNSGEMKVGEFQHKIDVSSTSYRNFMGQSGPTKGMESDTFSGASEFFMKREMAGLKMPRAKKAKTSAGGAGAAKDDGGKAKKATAKDKSGKDDVSSIQLEGEGQVAIPIYDTCDDVRTKVNRYMRDTQGATNAGFVRMVNAAAFPSQVSTEHHAAARHLTTFLNGKGPVKGSENPVFYAAYAFFEKVRVKEGKPKSKKRTEMESVWGKQGMPRDDFTNGSFYARAGQRAYIDKYGQFTLEG